MAISTIIHKSLLPQVLCLTWDLPFNLVSTFLIYIALDSSFSFIESRAEFDDKWLGKGNTYPSGSSKGILLLNSIYKLCKLILKNVPIW